MKNLFLLLSCCTLLAACGSDQPAAQETNTPAEATASTTEETVPATDSTTGANLAAVARQPQVDTSVTKIGTAPTGGAGAAGAKLMQSADCGSCHRENEKLLGPGYKEIAAKYPATSANVQMLATKIIRGGSGSWGAVAMTPHPGLSEKDAAEMTRYILSLK